jgi:hypothetical protein
MGLYSIFNVSIETDRPHCRTKKSEDNVIPCDNHGALMALEIGFA